MEEHMNEELARTGMPVDELPPADDRPRLRGVELISEGSSTHLLHRGNDASVRLTIANPRTLPVRVGVSLCRADGLYCFGTGTSLANLGPFCDPEIKLDVTFEHLPLQQGTYYITVGLFGAKDSAVYEFSDRVYDFQVTHRDGYEGLVYLPHTWRVG
jgi:hypothetical protein